MDDQVKPADTFRTPIKSRKPRAPKKAARFAKPITRGQGVAWGTLGLTLGNAVTLALAKWLGIY